MKTTLSIALAGITLLTFTGALQAQYNGTGAYGLTVSPKQQQFINEAKRQPAAVAATPKMACSKCKDQLVTRTDATARGAVKTTVKYAKHLCQDCKTSIKTLGIGKAATSVAVHTCGVGDIGKAACCKSGS
ncbi:MAG: hypothetical protein H7Y43_06805 [Akkermansiaceae bacterium]|nr:hypothetical protein [Verrucomicrobiales bacterium]